MTDQAGVEGLETDLAALSVAAGVSQPDAGDKGAAPRNGADKDADAGKSDEGSLLKKVEGLSSLVGKWGNEVGEVRKLAAEFRGLVNGLQAAGGIGIKAQAQAQAKADEFESLVSKLESGDAELAEKVADDPKAMMKIMAQGLKAAERRVASVLQDRDAFYEKKIEEVDPAISTNRERITRIRESNPQKWESFTDKQIATLLRDADEARNKTGGANMTTTGARGVPAYAGVPGGQRRAVASVDGASQPKNVLEDQEFMAMFGEGMRKRYGEKFDQLAKTI